MTECPCPGRPFRLAAWTVDPEESSIRGAQGKTKIDYKAMHVLCFLAHHAQRTVTREQIFDHVWPETAVSDEVLTVAISTLRRALEDDAKKPTFIRTFPKRGYRLLVAPSALAPRSAKPLERPAVRGLVALGVGSMLGAMAYLSLHPETASKPEQIRSIAVLPFENYSEDEARQYIADGITEALTTRLAQTGQLEVTSATTARSYRGTKAPLDEIAHDLGVDAVLEGSVQVIGDQLRLHSQLIHAATDVHLWAQDYDRPLDDLFELQSELATTITAKVLGGPVPTSSSVDLEKIDPVAYDLFLEGRYFRNQTAPGSLARAALSLEQSISVDPAFALAHASLAEVLFMRVEAGELSPREGFPRGMTSAKKALALDPDLPEANAAKAIAAFSLEWDFEEAGRSFDRAIAGSDPSAETLKWYVRFLVVTGRYEESVEVAERIQDIDPLSYVNLAHVLAMTYSGRYDAALVRLGNIAAVLPPSPGIDAAYAQIHLQQGHHDEAVKAVLRLAETAGWSSATQQELESAFATSGSLGVYEILASDESPFQSKALRAKFRVALGHEDEALRLLEDSVTVRDMNVLWLNADRSFDRIRRSARFRELIREIGLPDPPGLKAVG